MAMRRARGNIFDYLHDEQRAFTERSLRDADLLAFSALSHAEFERAPELADLLPLKLGMLGVLPQSARLTANAYLGPLVDEVLTACTQSPRFKEAKLLAVHTRFDKDEVIQFGAAAFELPGARHHVVVAYRGTGDELTGWHEDFDLALLEEIPAQREAARFLEQVAREHPSATFTLAGHSKGGALAEYAALFSGEQARARIERVVSFDGPGLFKLSGHACEEFATFDARLAERYAQAPFPMKRYVFASFVGLMLEPRPLELFSYCTALPREFPHNMTAPVIEDGEFSLRVPGTEELVRATALNRWVEQLTLEERRCVVNALFAEYQTANERLEFTKFVDLFMWAGMLVHYQARASSHERIMLGRVLGLLVRELSR